MNKNKKVLQAIKNVSVRRENLFDLLFHAQVLVAATEEGNVKF